MLVNGKRALAYITTLDEIKPIDGYDKVEYGRTSGWWCVISKSDNIEVGDKIIYFEVDSKVPSSDERFAFLEKKNYKIKTQKMCKVLSQGLIMPITIFPELQDKPVNTDVTDILGITYASEEDNKRKASNDKSAMDSMMARHKKLFKKPFIKRLMKSEAGRKIIFFLFGRKKDKPRGFPEFVSKTDEERIENVPWRLSDNDKTWVATEKLDGTSCTYALKRKGRNKFEFYVCSRNVRQKDETQSCYHNHNIYWDLAFKYNIEKHLKDYLNLDKDEDWVCIQGEGVGSVQGNPLKLKEDDLYIFNFITSKLGRLSSFQGRDIISNWGMKWVPVIGLVTLPKTMEEMKALATGESKVNSTVLREGIVYRSMDGVESFKNVSNEYLLKHNG